MGERNLILSVLFIALAIGVLSGRPVPGALRKFAMNNNGRLFTKRDGVPGPAESNQIPPLPDYYDESEEIRCPPGTTLFFRSGQCVPDRCGFGMVRDHVTGDCINDEEMPNNIPIMDAFIEPRPARGHGVSRGKPSRAIMRVLG